MDERVHVFETCDGVFMKGRKVKGVCHSTCTRSKKVVNWDVEASSHRHRGSAKKVDDDSGNVRRERNGMEGAFDVRRATSNKLKVDG